jgi:thiosulfate/3-mercaptopyruvate sulfurtransferase
MDDLISVEWLAGNIGAPDLVVLESTKYLPNEGKDGKAAFLRAHIPGARYFDLDLIADTDSALPHMVPAAGRFARLVGELGVSDHSRVVFYDQNATMWATRGWWMMGLFGHDAVAVLDGGLAAWERAGHAVQSGEPPAIAPVTFTPRLRAQRLRGLVQGHRSGAAAWPGGRPHSRLGQPAVIRAVRPGWPLPASGPVAHQAARRRGRWQPPGDRQLRQRRVGHRHRDGRPAGRPAATGRV